MSKPISSIKRISIFLLAIVIGVVVVYGFSLLGNVTRGPLTNVMEKLGDVVSDIDYKYTLGKRENLRKEKLKWFDAKHKRKNSLINPDVLLVGGSDEITGDSFANVLNLEDSLDTYFPLIHIFAAWGSKPEEQFPVLETKAIIGMGSIPIITWEPWLVDFDAETKELEKHELDFNKTFLAITEGIYDSYIRTWAKEAAKIGTPIYVRFAHEMNDSHRYPWATKTNTPEEFVDGWKHVHNIFQEEKANNVIWVWSPHIAYKGFERYYPGDDYVDVVGTTTLNYGTVVDWSQWWTFKELFGDYYDKLEKINKPIMICELGSLTVGGDRSEWFKDAMYEIINDYPLIRSIVFYHYPRDISVTDYAVSWRIKNDTETVRKIKEFLKKR